MWQNKWSDKNEEIEIDKSIRASLILEPTLGFYFSFSGPKDVT